MTDVSQLIAAFRRNHPEKVYLTDKQIIAELKENINSFTWVEQQAIMEAFSGTQEPVGDMANFSQSKKTDTNDPLAKFIPQDGSVPKPKEANKGFWAGVLAAGAGVVTWIASRGKVKPQTLAAGAAVVAGTATLASCTPEENFTQVNVDASTEVSFGQVRELIETLKQQHAEDQAKYDAMLAALNNMESQVEGLTSAVNQIMNLVQSVLTSVNAGNSDLTALLEQVLKKIEDGSDKNLDMLNRILTVISNMDSQQGDAIKLLNEIVSKLDTMTAQDKEFYDKVINAIEDLSISNTETAQDLMGVLNNIWSAINSGNNISNTQTAILNDILTAITELKNASPEYAEQISGLLNQVINSIKDGTEVNASGFEAVLDVLKSIQSGNEANAEAIINTIKAMWEDIAAGNTEIINALKELSNSGAANNKELMEFIQGLYNDSQINSDERTDKIVDAINSVGQMVAKLENTVQTTGDAISNAIKDLSTDLKALLEAYQEGNATTQDVLLQLRAILRAVNEGNGIGNVTNELLVELLDKAEQIINQGGDFKDYTEVLNEILDAINAVAAGIGDIKLSLGESNANITAALEEIINNQNIQTEALNKFAAESKANQEKLIEQGNDIIGKLDKIGADLNQGISNIIEKLKDSDAQLAAQLAALVDALGLKMDNNGQAIVNAIEGLKGNLTAIEDAINNLIKIAGNDSVDLTTTNNLIQTVINLLAQQENPVFDLSEVTSLLAANNELLEQLLNKENGGTIDTGAIEQALADILEAVKNMNVGGSGGTVDLTTTNNLIQTCINQLSLLVQASSTNTDIMASVTNLGTQLTEVIANLQSGNVTTDEINAKLDEIMAAINSLTNSINA